MSKVYLVRAKTLGVWRPWKAYFGRSAARREALRLAYDCGFTWDNVEVL